jgi:hypothetical protein
MASLSSPLKSIDTGENLIKVFSSSLTKKRNKLEYETWKAFPFQSKALALVPKL